MCLNIDGMVLFMDMLRRSLSHAAQQLIIREGIMGSYESEVQSFCISKEQPLVDAASAHFIDVIGVCIRMSGCCKCTLY